MMNRCVNRLWIEGPIEPVLFFESDYEGRSHSIVSIADRVGLHDLVDPSEEEEWWLRWYEDNDHEPTSWDIRTSLRYEFITSGAPPLDVLDAVSECHPLVNIRIEFKTAEFTYPAEAEWKMGRRVWESYRLTTL